VTRRIVAVVLTLMTWIAGTVVGSISAAPSAAGAAPLLMIGKAKGSFEPPLTGSDPIFILILGSDARPGTPMDRGLADSIHILGINPDAHRATLFGIPRDSYVPLSTGGTNKINSAMPQGGPEAEAQTVSNLTGIKFDYWVLTGFGTFVSAVDTIGGIAVNVPYDFAGYDHTFTAGPTTLDGPAALDFARTRHSVPLGDFDRSMNQGRLMIGALAQFRAEFAKDPGRLYTWLGAGLRNTQSTLPIDELMRLAFTAKTLSAVKVSELVAMGSTATVNGMSIVQLSSENQALWDDMKTDGYILPKDIPAQALATPPSG
jgi:LCP family protein required for cell wall assembly